MKFHFPPFLNTALSPVSFTITLEVCLITDKAKLGTNVFYLLDNDNIKVVLLESNHPASGASGKSGGLVARWAYPKELVDVSFEEHLRLARKWDGEKRWGWREVECGSWEGEGVTRDSSREGGAAKNGRILHRNQILRIDLAPSEGSTNMDTQPIPKVINGLNEDAIQQSKNDPSRRKKKNSKTGHPDDLDWIDKELAESYTSMADPGSGDTAQVHPYLFTNAMLQLALENPKTEGKVEFIQGRATGIDYISSTEGVMRQVKGVRYIRTTPGGGGGWTSAPPIPSVDSKGVSQFSAESVASSGPGDDEGTRDDDSGEEVTLPADQILLCAGPWSGSLLEGLPITCTRAHSITIRPPLKHPSSEERKEISPYALFTRIEMPDPSPGTSKGRKKPKVVEAPEIYARPNQEVYVCGGTDEGPLPDIRLGTKGVKVEKEQCDALFKQVSSISSIVARGEITARQACYLPTPTVETRGSPIIGKVEGLEGMYVATGHTCWGICNAPGTAKVMSELMLEGEVKCCRIGSMQPQRFM